MKIEDAPEVTELLERFSEAWRNGDVDGVLSTISSDARVLMAGPTAVPVRGREAVTTLLRQFVAMNSGSEIPTR